MKDSMMELKVAEVNGFYVEDVIKELNAKNDENFLKFERVVMAHLWQEVKENPKVAEIWERTREISRPISFSDEEEKECFGKRNQYEIKDLKQRYSKRLQRKLKEQGWEARVTPAWITLSLPRPKKQGFWSVLKQMFQ